jgi:hypothetical protein
MLLRELGVPRSTAASWIRRGPRPVVFGQAQEIVEESEGKPRGRGLPGGASEGHLLR